MKLIRCLTIVLYFMVISCIFAVNIEYQPGLLRPKKVSEINMISPTIVASLKDDIPQVLNKNTYALIESDSNDKNKKEAQVPRRDIVVLISSSNIDVNKYTTGGEVVIPTDFKNSSSHNISTNSVNPISVTASSSRPSNTTTSSNIPVIPNTNSTNQLINNLGLSNVKPNETIPITATLPLNLSNTNQITTDKTDIKNKETAQTPVAASIAKPIEETTQTPTFVASNTAKSVEKLETEIKTKPTPVASSHAPITTQEASKSASSAMKSTETTTTTTTLIQTPIQVNLTTTPSDSKPTEATPSLVALTTNSIKTSPSQNSSSTATIIPTSNTNNLISRLPTNMTKSSTILSSSTDSLNASKSRLSTQCAECENKNDSSITKARLSTDLSTQCAECDKKKDSATPKERLSTECTECKVDEKSANEPSETEDEFENTENKKSEIKDDDVSVKTPIKAKEKIVPSQKASKTQKSLK